MAKEKKAKRSLGKRLLRGLATYLVVSLVAVVVLRVTGCAERLAYWPSRTEFVTPEGYEDVWIQTPDGAKLHGWFMPAIGVEAGAVAPAVLHVHGNAGNISYHESFSGFLNYSGFHVLLFDYRGYGRSDEHGTINRTNLAIDTRAALAYLMSREDVDPSRVGVLGVSLGGPFALDATVNEPRVSAVATLSTFSTWGGVAEDLAGIGSVLIHPGLEPVDLLRGLGNRPYLIMQGLSDQVVDPRHAELLNEAAEDSFVDVTLRTYPGDHNSLIQYDRDAQRDLVEFFQRHLRAADD